MEKYFDRQIQLWGIEKQQDLSSKHVLVVGCGGLGCSLAIALGASGIGKITLIDFDTVGIHNIHRQIAFKLDDVNKLKCDVLKEILIERSPYVEVDNFNGNFSEYIAQTTDVPTLILDATDNLETRLEIDKYAKTKKLAWIYGSVEEFHGQVCLFSKSDFDSIFNIKKIATKGIAAPIVMNIASLQANLALRYLLNMAVKQDVLYYLFFNEIGEFNIQKFGLPTS